MRVFRLRYPMFNEITFSPNIPADAFPHSGSEIDFRFVIIAQGEQRTTLLDVLSQMIHNVAERCLPLPCWFDVNFPGGTLSLLGKDFPLEKVEIHFTRFIEIEQRKQMRIPIGSSYSFKPNTGEGLSIAERDLPPLNPK